MEEHAYDNDTLERYLLDRMDMPEKQRFEDALQQSRALREDLALQQDIMQGIQLHGSQDMKHILQGVEQEMNSTPPTPQARSSPSRTSAQSPVSDLGTRRKPSGRPLLTWLAVAASVLMVVLLGYLLVRNGPADTQVLYAAYYEPYPNIINPAQRSGDDTKATVPERAVRAYEAGQYAEAIALFGQSDAVSSNAGFAFYHALSYLGAEQPTEAISLLKPLAQDERVLFYEPARWYLALAYLNTDQSDAAVPYLKQLASTNGDYAEEAQQLLQDLD